MRQTYNHAGVSIYHGDCRELVLPEPADVMTKAVMSMLFPSMQTLYAVMHMECAPS